MYGLPWKFRLPKISDAASIPKLAHSQHAVNVPRAEASYGACNGRRGAASFSADAQVTVGDECRHRPALREGHN
jgi:hypothetical protein